MTTIRDAFDKEKFKEIAATWNHSHKYSPAPRHRRNIILKLLDKISFTDVLDAGCAQPYLLQEIILRYSIKGYGCDISTKVIENNKVQLPNCEFHVIDLAKEAWPEQQQFDLVISSEVIEHIENWHDAVKHLAQMAKNYLLITVPSGKRRIIDKKLGHFRHYEGKELQAEIEKNGFECINIIKHGFPLHSLYKHLINFIAPDKIYDSFSGGKEYSFFQKIFCHGLYYLFYVNYLFRGGEQIIILAKRRSS